MYLVKVSVFKTKGETLSAVALPSFFKNDDVESIRRHIYKQFGWDEVATIYLEYIPESPKEESK